jgi:hypothetical protein
VVLTSSGIVVLAPGRTVAASIDFTGSVMATAALGETRLTVALVEVVATAHTYDARSSALQLPDPSGANESESTAALRVARLEIAALARPAAYAPSSSDEGTTTRDFRLVEGTISDGGIAIPRVRDPRRAADDLTATNGPPGGSAAGVGDESVAVPRSSDRLVFDAFPNSPASIPAAPSALDGASLISPILKFSLGLATVAGLVRLRRQWA